MKKRAWLIPFFAIAMVAVASISAWAAEGWAWENNSWVYYNNSGNKVSDTWRKGVDDLWRYLDSRGVMATDTWVDDNEYYVDSEGIMVESKWLKISDDNDGTNWYYFDSKGKAVKEKWQKINNNWYYFDDNGTMQTGWILDNMYYCSDDGVMKTGWQKLNDPDDDNLDDDKHVTPFFGTNTSNDDDDVHWYYFSTSNGKKYTPNLEGADYGERKVDGKRYCFSEDGAMQTGWVNVEGTGESSDSIKDFKYYNEDGSVRTGWYSVEPPEDIMVNYDDDVMWFYFTSTGVPKAAENKDYKTTDIEKIGGRYYLFNEKGNPVYGLQKVYIGTTTEYTSYYFGSKDQCNTQSGKVSVTEDNGDTSKFYFMSSGRGFTGVHDGYLYYIGKIQKADRDSKYEVIRVDNVNYVVGTSGKIEKNRTVKNADGVKYTTNSGGVLTKIDEEAVDAGYTGKAPENPVFEENN